MRALQLLRTGLEVSLWQPCVELFSRGREGGREGGRGKERERGREGEREREKEGRGREREREREGKLHSNQYYCYTKTTTSSCTLACTKPAGSTTCTPHNVQHVHITSNLQGHNDSTKKHIGKCDCL